MSNKDKIFEILAKFVENGILTTQDIKKGISSNLKSQKDNIINTLDLVSRKEFEVLKKIVQKQEIKIKKMAKKPKKGGKS